VGRGRAPASPRTFRLSWTSGNAVRTNSEAIVKSELRDIGINITEYPRAAT